MGSRVCSLRVGHYCAAMRRSHCLPPKPSIFIGLQRCLDRPDVYCCSDAIERSAFGREDGRLGESLIRAARCVRGCEGAVANPRSMCGLRARFRLLDQGFRLAAVLLVLVLDWSLVSRAETNKRGRLGRCSSGDQCTPGCEDNSSKPRRVGRR